MGRAYDITRKECEMDFTVRINEDVAFALTHNGRACSWTHLVRTMPAQDRVRAGTNWLVVEDLSEEEQDEFADAICPKCKQGGLDQLYDCITHWHEDHLMECGATCCSCYEVVCHGCETGFSFDMSA